MNILLITSFSDSTVENKRIREEVEKMGHNLEVFTTQDFAFSIENSEIKLEGAPNIDNIDLVIVRGILNSIKPLSAYIGYLREKGIKVFDNALSSHQYTINKVSDLLKLASKNIAIPDTYYARDFSEYKKYAEKLGYPFIIKSTGSGKGRGVYKIDNEQELIGFIEGATENEKNAKGYILQQFVEYEHDLRVLIIGDEINVMKRIPGEGEFRANFSLGGSVEIFDLDEEGKTLAKNALAAVDMSVGGVDVLIAKSGERYILEVNHAAGFAGMEEATGKNIGEIYVKNAISKAV